MAQMVGADVEALRRLAVQMDQSAQRLRSIAGSISNGVRVTAWVGPVSVRFRTSWDTEHSVKLKSAAGALENNARILRQNAAEQEAASASLAGGAGSKVVTANRAADATRSQPPWINRAANSVASAFTDGLDGAMTIVTRGGEAISNLNDITETVMGKGNDAITRLLPHGNLFAAGLKGIGLGTALADFGNAFQRHDPAGMMGATADGVFTFVSAPVSLLYNGLKAETEFFIPLDSASYDEHVAWMHDRGYDDNRIAERYQGVQGFIDLGNDNVERKAPWMNDVADKVMQKPAEWIYNAGIKLY